MAKKVIPRFKTRQRRKTFFREWRKYRGLTLEQAAEKAGMTPGNLSAMERGTQGFTQDGLEALADVYKANPGWLLDVDPKVQEDIFSVWEAAKPGDRKKIIDISKTLIGKTGTDGH
jgi:transcriptional regulator with XRE-family HTH domain